MDRNTCISHYNHWDVDTLRRWWKYWARALGEKVGEDNRSADWVALWRTLIVIQAVVTNVLIVWNILRKW